MSKSYEPPIPPKPLPIDQNWALLGGRSPQEFMKAFWHKKPLLVRGGIPAFNLAKAQNKPLDSPISTKTLLQFAQSADCESRLVRSKPWNLYSGPLSKKDIPQLEDPNWTILLQGMEAVHPAAAKILSWFRFIPDARLDDLMISIAGPGGGVGPHFDSYDVFLIQMSGRRRWKISEQTDLSLKPSLPLKILKHFKAEFVWDLEPGDMLYLPPHIAHEGIALDPGCQTWSVGFRAPSYQELLQEGLWRLAESLENLPHLASHFADPLQNATDKAEQLPGELIRQLEGKLRALKLQEIDTFLPGITAYLSEPKPQAIFVGRDDLTPAAFAQQLSKQDLLPHPQTRILSLGETVFCNGENVTQNEAPAIQEAWKKLSKFKALQAGYVIGKNAHSSLLEAYRSGWLEFANR